MQHSILGFLSGAVLSGGALYYYVIDEYRVSNELLTEDIYVSLLLSLPPSLHTTDKRQESKQKANYSGIIIGTPICCLAHRRLCQGSRGKSAQVN